MTLTFCFTQINIVRENFLGLDLGTKSLVDFTCYCLINCTYINFSRYNLFD